MNTTEKKELYSTDVQLEAIKKAIQTELLKRGFQAPIVKIEEKTSSRSSRHRIEFHTEKFQTTPVLFEELRVQNFSSEIYKEMDDEREVTKFYIGVNVAYNHFNLGSNSSELFTIRGCLSERGIYNITIK